MLYDENPQLPDIRSKRKLSKTSVGGLEQGVKGE